jgi:hypothetical protein
LYIYLEVRESVKIEGSIVALIEALLGSIANMTRTRRKGVFGLVLYLYIFVMTTIVRLRLMI